MGIIAHEDATSAVLKFEAPFIYEGIEYSTRNPLTVVLNQKQVLHLDDTEALQELEITSDKRISVFVGGK